MKDPHSARSQVLEGEEFMLTGRLQPLFRVAASATSLFSAPPGTSHILEHPISPPGPWVIERVFAKYRSLEILGGGLSAIGLALVADKTHLPIATAIAALAGIAVLVLLMEVLARVETRRIERTAKEFDNTLCLICGYCLKHLPKEHICPECGTRYDMALVKTTWERYFEAQR